MILCDTRGQSGHEGTRAGHSSTGGRHSASKQQLHAGPAARSAAALLPAHLYGYDVQAVPGARRLLRIGFQQCGQSRVVALLAQPGQALQVDRIWLVQVDRQLVCVLLKSLDLCRGNVSAGTQLARRSTSRHVLLCAPLSSPIPTPCPAAPRVLGHAPT